MVDGSFRDSLETQPSEGDKERRDTRHPGHRGTPCKPGPPARTQGRPASEAAGAMPREAAGTKSSCISHRGEHRQALPSLSPDPNWENQRTGEQINS